MKNKNGFSNLSKRLAAAFLAVCMTVICVMLPSSRGMALYNDEKYDNYKNMSYPEENNGRTRYIVPNLYRQDASYTNVKTFPLVVSDSTEYFPLDIFAMYSYLKVVYSKISYGFYISNTKNNHYVAFDLNTGTTTTHDNQTLDIQAKLFYRTHYVPAKAVCEILGMNFESYDNEEDGIHAARLSDERASYTLTELVTMYSPPKPETPVTPTPDDTPGSEDTPDPPTPPDVIDVPVSPDPPPVVDPPVRPTDPYENVAQRNLYLTYENVPNDSTAGILDVLDRYGAKGVFFLEKEHILEHPDTVRRMITGGHTVGLYLNPAGEEAAADPLTAELEETNNALYLVTKTKTHFVRFAPESGALTENLDLAAFAEQNGYRLYGWNLDGRETVGTVTAAYDRLLQAIVGNNPRAARSLHVRMGSSASARGVTERLLAFCSEHARFNVATADEFTVPA